MFIMIKPERDSNVGGWGTNTKIEKVKPKDGEGSLEFLYRNIGCKFVDVVKCEYGIDIYVDDEGLYANSEDDPMWNYPATALRTVSWLLQGVPVPYNYAPIAGTAILASHNEEGDIIGLDAAQIAFLKTIGLVPREEGERPF